MKAPVPAEVTDELIAQQTLGATAATIYAGVNSCGGPDQLDAMARLLWKGCSEGKITDGEATYLSSVIERRRPLHHTAPQHAKPFGGIAGRLCGRFTPRQRQRSPDRKASRDRRRVLGGSSVLPSDLRQFYTEGQRSVLCVIVGEVKRHGVCDLPTDKIAALAGVGRTTVQTTLHEARRLHHVRITERPQRSHKNLPNVVEIISPRWRTWIRRAPSAARLIGSNSSKMASPTKSTDLKKKAADEKKPKETNHTPR
jgi:hypothetical protein